MVSIVFSITKQTKSGPGKPGADLGRFGTPGTVPRDDPIRRPTRPRGRPTTTIKMIKMIKMMIVDADDHDHDHDDDDDHDHDDDDDC